MAAIHALLEGCLDYAGLFPPASLDFASALDHYIHYQSHPRASLLGRFVLPAARVKQAAERLEGITPEPRLAALIRLSAPESFEAELEGAARSLDAFPAADTIEATLPPEGDFRRQVRLLTDLVATDSRAVFVELDWRREVAGPMDIVAGEGRGAGVKLRTGGLTADAVPPAAAVANWVAEAARRRLPMKATAGLHVPAPNFDPAVGARMHGFLNLMTCALAAWHGLAGAADLEEILADYGYGDFHFNETELRCREYRFSEAQIADCRARFFRSFGTCSFLEPVARLEEHGIL
ncbi:MAG: hypothetical protein KIT09_34795 [Bryobacteraceae bacterium]|nr:hypothetical protein [Bryobacteraceae bacterium]